MNKKPFFQNIYKDIKRYKDMPSKESNFVGINLPRYLVEDIDRFIKTHEKYRFTTRAGFIVHLINDFLNEEALKEERDLPDNKKSARAKLKKLIEWYDNLTVKEVRDDPGLEFQFDAEYDKLEKEIRKESKK